MPILGKDYQPEKKEEPEKSEESEKPEEPVIKRELKVVKANRVHPSTILPERERSQDVIDSVKRDGVQQPIIVRPHPHKLFDYEIIDGWNRYLGAIGGHRSITFFNDETAPDIVVDIRYGLTESEIFRLSYDTQIRKDRTTFERAAYYDKWIKTKANELGMKKGAKTEVAKEIVEITTSLDPKENPQIFEMEVNTKQSLISQYCKVYEVITTLEQKYPNNDFDFLKVLSVNKLYALSKRLDNLLVLKEIVDKIEKNPKMKLERIKDLLHRDQRVIENVPSYSVTVSIPEDRGKSLHKALYRSNKQIFNSSISTKQILAKAVRQLLELYLIYPEEYEIELEKTKQGNKIKAIWHKVAEPTQ